MMLITLQQAKDHLRIDHDDEDNDLTLKIHAASAIVIGYLKSGATFLDSSGDLEYDSNDEAVGVPYEVKAASMLMLGFLYKDRDANTDGAYEQGYLPKPVTALLYRLRDPAIA